MGDELSKGEKLDGLIYGTIVGVISIIFAVVSIYITRVATSSSSLYFITTSLNIVGSIIIPVLFVYLLKKKNGANWSFSRALKSIYILLAASLVVSSLGVTVYQKTMNKIVLEESYHNLLNLRIVDMEDKGATEEEIDKDVERIEQQKEFALSKFSFRNTIAPVFVGLLLYFIFAVVLALLFRSTPNQKAVSN